MKIHLATDHAGYELKESLKGFLADAGYECIDHGAYELDTTDDYPDYVALAAKAVSDNPDEFGIVLGGSGQGEAIVANRFSDVRAVVYYGEGPPSSLRRGVGGGVLDIIPLAREHNNANILSIGARFIDKKEAKQAVQLFIETPFSKEERHTRRINKIDELEYD